MNAIEPDDPRLTAYTLGEMSDDESTEFEALIADDPDAQAEIHEIRNAAQQLTREFAGENVPQLTAEQRMAILAVPYRGFWRRHRWRHLIAASASAAAACAAIGLFLPALSQSRKEARRINAAGNMQQIGLNLRKCAGNTGVQLVEPGSAAEEFRRQSEPWNREAYDRIVDNPFVSAALKPLSTFSIDVDTASYSNVRRFLTQNQRPPKDAVRIEELVNYFSYDYPQPDGEHPFSVNLEVAGCPWKSNHRLIRIGLKGREIAAEDSPASNLVFLLDVSGSMGTANKLPLLKQAMRMLVDRLTENDRVAIVVYAGASGLVLPSTGGERRADILAALDRLTSGGSTNGGAGIELAYRTATENFIEGGVNRVILATDGDFNVGTTSQGDLTRLIEEKAKTGVFLTVLGFGMGNYQDARLESLADKGNGNYAYIDTIREAQKVLVDQMKGTLITIAKDVKIQIDFNPAKVNAYRLIGYENRILAARDFNDDTKDAGEIGAGHTVTAFYEIVPAGVEIDLPDVTPSKYVKPAESATGSDSPELLTARLRYKAPDGDTSKLIEVPVTDHGTSYAGASGDFKFGASVAAFGMILRDSPHKGTTTLDAVLELADEGKGKDVHGYRAEFLQLVAKAKQVVPR